MHMRIQVSAAARAYFASVWQSPSWPCAASPGQSQAGSSGPPQTISARWEPDHRAALAWPNYYLPFLVRVGHLKPLGKPAQNARKWFATVEIERMSCDPDWLDKAIRIVEKQIQEMNWKQRSKGPDAVCVK